MPILKLTSPQGVAQYIAAAFPSACGNDQTSPCSPATIPGWKVEYPGVIASPGCASVRTAACGGNPAVRLLRRRAGYERAHQPERDEDHLQGQLGLHHVALTEDGDMVGRAWRTGRPRRPPGRASPDAGVPRWLLALQQLLCDPVKQCDSSPRVRRPAVRADRAILFGGRRKTTVTLVVGPGDRTHGTFLGATLARSPPPRSAPGLAAATDGDAAVHRLQRRRRLQPLDHGRQGERRGEAPGPSTSTGSAATTRAASAAGPRREQPGAQVGRRAHRRPGRRGRDPIGRRPWRRRAGRSTDGLDLTDEQLEERCASPTSRSGRPRSADPGTAFATSSATTCRPCSGP